ncbi:MAG: WD40 repeat domain-containing protein [Opitutaceae bacterium]
MDLAKHWAATLDDYVIDLAWSPDGSLLAAASAAGPVALYASADGARRQGWPGHAEGANCLAFAPAGPLLASGGQDGAIKLWDTESGQQTASIEVGPWIERMAWRPASTGRDALLGAAAGRKLLFVSTDGAVRRTVADAPKTITALAWEPRGGCLAAAHFGGVRLWDGDDDLLQKELPYNNGIHALAWSPDGRWLVSGNQDPSVHIWMPDTDLELQMSGYESKVKHLSFERSGHWLATSGGRDACVWDFSGAGPEGRAPDMFPHERPVCAVAFQSAHGLLATSAQDGSVMLWSPDRAQPLRATVRMPAGATKLAWSPDDRYLAIGAESGAVYVLRCEG